MINSLCPCASSDLIRPALWFWGSVRFSILLALFGFEVMMDAWMVVYGCGAPALSIR